MKNERFWRLAGVTASLLIVMLGLLALNLVAQPSEPVLGAGPNPSQGPALAALPAVGTPDPGSALQTPGQLQQQRCWGLCQPDPHRLRRYGQRGYAQPRPPAHRDL